MAAQVFVAVVLANLLCGWFGYALWRLSRDETDMRAIGIVLVCLAVFGFMAWPSAGDGDSVAAEHQGLDQTAGVGASVPDSL